MRQNVQELKIVVLGASGRTGRHVVATARRRGHRVAALVRRAGVIETGESVTEHLWSGPTDTVGFDSAIAGADVVISALGGATSGPTTVCTDAMRTVVPLMERAGVSRLIAVSAHGVLESRDRSLYVRAAWANVAERLRDKASMEPVITASSLRWTIVRPPTLSDRSARGSYRAGPELPVHVWNSIPRADLADFLVREAEGSAFVHAYPRVTR